MIHHVYVITIYDVNSYTIFSVSSFLQTKVEIDLGRSLSETWRKLFLPCITSGSREILYLCIHNKLSTRERLFRTGLVNDPYCPTCLDTIGAYICDREHVFCTCAKVKAVWAEVKTILVSLLPAGMCSLPDLQLISLDIPKFKDEVSYVWLIGNFMDFIWKNTNFHGTQLKRDEIFGFLRFKYKADQLGARLPLSVLAQLI